MKYRARQNKRTSELRILGEKAAQDRKERRSRVKRTIYVSAGPRPLHVHRPLRSLASGRRKWVHGLTAAAGVGCIALVL